ncbi:MAG: Asp-tRNA(Asn)/Glu-tRNA(Gln) amidotransferase GatCAB subunit B, partial [Clostridiales bacterium]|nr:Asp-tRNA(Asn)/Glu-tRNA(Gln) amidotransferase GatCAB subunit B [Clostridiales bacterium]
IPIKDVELIVSNKPRADFLDECVKQNADAKTVANWLLGDIAKLLNDSAKEINETKLTPSGLCGLLKLIEKSVISGSAGKKVLNALFEEGGDPEEITKKLGLSQVSDENAVRDILKEVLAQNEKSVSDYKSGKQAAFGFLVGQSMKASKGKANPQVVNKLLKELLDS